MCNKTFIKMMGEFSDKKSKTGPISLSSDEYQNYDIFSVYMSNPESEKQFPFENYKEGKVYALAWEENLQRFDTPVDFSVLNAPTLVLQGPIFMKAIV
jgi:hypothetical protein